MRDERLAGEIAALRETLRTLRGENGCAWDRARTAGDLISHLVDEAYELLRAEAGGDRAGIEEELGDVLFLVVFIHELLQERGAAPLSTLVAAVHKKIVERHPHVFGETSAANETQSQAEWDRIKRAGRPAPPDGALAEVPDNLPPLRRAFAAQRAAARVGFDWPDAGGVIDKLAEETAELRAALEADNRRHVREEIGDLLFTVVNLARVLGVECESALERSNAKFMGRFNEMERRALEAGTPLSSLTLEQMEALWRRAKRNDRSRERAGRGRTSGK